MTCQTCKFASKSTHQLNSYDCRRYPPAVHPVQSAQGVGAIVLMPMMPAEGWCGEYQPAVIVQPAQRAGVKMDA